MNFKLGTTRFWNIQFPYNDPENVDDNAGDEDDTPDNDLDIINDDEDTIDDDVDPAAINQDVVEEEDEDNEEEEEEEEEEEDEDSEELTKVNYQTLKTALKDNPKLLKSLKPLFFREQEFSRIFGSPKDAEVAAQQSILYEDLRDLVVKGNVSKILKDVKEVSDKSLENFAENFLPALQKVDEQAYYKITAPVLQGVLYSCFSRAKKANNENLQTAVRMVNELIFGDDTEITAPKFKEVKEEDNDKEQNEYFKKLEVRFLDDVVEVTDKRLDREIGDLDPTGVLKNRPKLVAKMKKEIIEKVKEQLASDEMHMRNMRQLLQRERRSGFSGQLKESMITAFLSRAKAIVPKIRREIRSEYLGVSRDTDTRLRSRIDRRDKTMSPGSMSKNKGKTVTIEDARKNKMSDRAIIDA